MRNTTRKSFASSPLARPSPTKGKPMRKLTKDQKREVLSANKEARHHAAGFRHHRMAQSRWARVSNQSEWASTPRHALLHKKREAHRPRYFCPAAEQGQAAQTESMTLTRSACLHSNAAQEVLRLSTRT